MTRRIFALSTAGALVLGLSIGAVQPTGAAAGPDWPEPEKATATVSHSLEKGTVISLGTKSRPELYVVQLADDPVPAYDGGTAGLAPTQPAKDDEFDPKSPKAKAYRGHLVREQRDLQKQISKITGRRAAPRFTYTDSINGIALELTRDQARKVAELPGVTAVQVEETRQLTTDVGPEWIGAPAIWSGEGTPDSAGTKGEDVLVGIIDSGINPANPSFHDVVPESAGGDGYDHTNPLGAGNYLGVCDPAHPDYVADWGCNDKLIGAYSFTGAEDAESPYDHGGHGSHTASTTAGNQVDATTYSARGTEHEFSVTRNIQGVAPHANIVAYDVCFDGCSTAGITAAIDQAILDGVDVINYSIGSDAASSPWTNPDALGFLNARAAGIHVATSAGNSGPGAATVGSPADVPWITSVGATTHTRQWQAHVQDITADGGATLPDFSGVGFSAATDGAFPLVYAGDFGAPLCEAGALGSQDLTGTIVICDRGTIGRVEKGVNVAALGAEGMILANDAASGASINADAHALPAVHLTHADGVALKEWLADATGAQASLSGGVEEISPGLADTMAAFSSRGPNRAVEMISPSVSAPGVDVLAANGSGNEATWGFMSGTSMASPHVAGSFTLLDAVHPDWTPAEAQSAVMTTAHTDVKDTDGSEAGWFDMGSGRIDLNVAAKAGLVLDETKADYLAANPAEDGDVKTLNVASMANNQCLQTCSWTRTVTGTATGAGTWTVSTESLTDGVDVTVTPSTFTIAEGQDVELTITADVRGATTDDRQFGTVVLTPAEGSAAPAAHLPLAVVPSSGVLPESIAIQTRRDAGSQPAEGLKAIEISDLQVSANGLVPLAEQELSVVEDDTNDDPYDGNGTAVVNLDVPEAATRLVINLADATAQDFDLYIGTGEVSAANLVCRSASGGSAETCDIGDPAAGNWWILVQNWAASEPGGTDTVTLGTAVVAGDAGNLRAEGPQSNPAEEPFDLRVFYDEPELDAGETWYGSITLGSSADSPTDIGTIPVTVRRLEDDVIKSVSAASASPGDTLTYTVAVQPNATPEDAAYTITDALPDGTTYVDASAQATSGEVSVTDGVLTWQGTQPTLEGVQGDYAITTSGSDASCVNPFTGTAEYTNLQDFGIAAQDVSGDTLALTAFGSESFGFYGQQYAGLTLTDDGFLVYDAGTNYGGSPWAPQSLPDAALPNNVAAMLWQDMQLVYDQAANSGVSIASAGDLKIIEFDDMRAFDDPTGANGTYDFEVFAIVGSQDLVFAYDNLAGPLDGPLTIGTEDADGDAASTLVNQGSAAGAISDGTVVCATYQGPSAEPVEITYQVTVDDDVTDGEVISNEAVHVTDNPGAEEVTASTDFTAVVTDLITVEGTKDAEEPRTEGLFTFTRPTGSADDEVTVSYEVAGSARAGKDYVPLDGEVTFAAGEDTATEEVELLKRRGRNKRERTVEITLVPGDGYEVGDPSSGSIEIIDDPPGNSGG